MCDVWLSLRLNITLIQLPTIIQIDKYQYHHHAWPWSGQCSCIKKNYIILYHSSDIKTLNLKLLFFKGVDPRIFWKSPHLAFLKWGICPRSFPPSLPLTPREELPRRPEASFVAVSLRQLFHLKSQESETMASFRVGGAVLGAILAPGDLGIILFLDMYI